MKIRIDLTENNHTRIRKRQETDDETLDVIGLLRQSKTFKTVVWPRIKLCNAVT